MVGWTSQASEPMTTLEYLLNYKIAFNGKMFNVIFFSWFRAVTSASLIEGNAYFVEFFLYHPEGDGHFILKARGPSDNSSIVIPREQLVEYQKSK